MLESRKASLSLSIVIVTYNRSDVLTDTIRQILGLNGYASHINEIIIVDQTIKHSEDADEKLRHWSTNGVIDWLRLDKPHLSGAMNTGLLHAKSDIVLYLDDDVILDDEIALAHLQAHQEHASVTAVIGKILQPGERAVDTDYQAHKGTLRAYMDFPFYSTSGCFIENAMAGNMSLKRELALRVGGFDERFMPPVAARFESEFAKRVIREGGTIWFEPEASLQHLAVKTGGTRSEGSHLNSAQPYFGFGDYYFALRHGSALECLGYCLYRFYREVRTKYHMTHPWAIPVKWLGEIRAFSLAVRESRKPQKLISPHNHNNVRR